MYTYKGPIFNAFGDIKSLLPLIEAACWLEGSIKTMLRADYYPPNTIDEVQLSLIRMGKRKFGIQTHLGGPTGIMGVLAAAPRNDHRIPYGVPVKELRYIMTTGRRMFSRNNEYFITNGHKVESSGQLLNLLPRATENDFGARFKSAFTIDMPSTLREELFSTLGTGGWGSHDIRLLHSDTHAVIRVNDKVLTVGTIVGGRMIRSYKVAGVGLRHVPPNYTLIQGDRDSLRFSYEGGLSYFVRLTPEG